jgi:uncharacterized RDD family membrane protein YckC/type II secretory pathway pseudopilin PulG
MFCTHCGKKNPDAARFCFACGRMLADASASDAIAPSTRENFIGPAADGQTRVSGFSGGTTSGQQFAGFWTRFAASMLDTLVIVGLALIGTIVFGVIGIVSGSPSEAWVFGGYYLASFFSWWLYPAVTESSKRQGTLGKRAVRIIVTDTAGRRISFGRATGRVFSKILNGLTLGVGWIMVGVSAQKRGLHDLAAGTMVVKAANARPASALVTALISCAVAIPLLGIVGAIAVPGLLRARMSGNETAAIGALRAIHSAQEAYHRACGGYAPTLPALASPSQFLAADLTGASSVSHNGYTLTVGSATDAETVLTTISGCEGAVSAYFASATPITFGSTGTRYFAINISGVIFWDDDSSFRNARVLQ